ncbi:MAG: spondin domain-containing protein [Candidatus Micrarchaeota archaeon]
MRAIAAIALFVLLSGCFLFPSEEPAQNETGNGEPETPPAPPQEEAPPPANDSQGENATTGPAPPEPPKKDVFLFNVTVENIHDSYSLSSGIFIVHKQLTSFNYVAGRIPDSLEPLVEYGDVREFASFAGGEPGVVGLYPVPALHPGEKASFIIEVPKDRPRETQLSGIMMVLESNDGISLADAITLFTTNDVPLSSKTYARNYDAGTEENSPLGSGFEGGQPDPSKGDENIGNGVPSDPFRPVIPHPELQQPLMRVTVSPS